MDTCHSSSLLANLFTVAISNLATSLYDELKKKYPDENLLFSPLSIFSALSMTMGGAREETQKQMANGLHLPNDKANDSEFHQLLGEYLKNVLPVDDENSQAIITNLANAIFADKSLPIVKSFEEMMSKAYEAKISNVDFINNAERERELINDWVAEQTKNRITDLIPSGSLDSMTRMVLVNAIYFKGLWKMPFDSELTRKDEVFTNIRGEAEKVDMMFMSSKKFEMSYSNEKELDCFTLKLPYEDERYNMYITLSNKQDGLNTLEQKLNDGDNLRKLLTTGFRSSKVDITMPKFRLESKFKLNDMLKALGMTHMFTDGANFSGITESMNLKISDVLHKAFLEVNEKGSEAAAATGVGIMTLSLPPQFIVNRPFILAIGFNDTPLFIGRVATLK